MQRLLSTLLLILLAAPAAWGQGGPLDGFAAYVEQARQDWGVPGLAVAVVKDGDVVFAEGFGVRAVGTEGAVDAGTVFSNASTTKAFIAVALGMLVDEGKVDLDAPVITYLPGFRVADPYVTRELRVRDLLTHRTGVRPANLWFYGVERGEYIRRLRHAEQATSLRSAYQYNNDMYEVAGDVIRAASGLSWEDFLRQRILRPLGMTATHTGPERVDAIDNLAQAHDLQDDTLRVTRFPGYRGLGAAGAMLSNVTDMARWMTVLLDSTRTGQGRLLEPGTFAELWQPQMQIDGPSYPAATQANPHLSAYGLGWFLQDYRGHLLAMHTGSLRGMNALVGLLPEQRLGLVVFANRSGAEVRHALMYDVFDRYLGPTGKDWSADLLTLYTDMDARDEQARAERDAKRRADTRPSLPLADYAGTYADSLYGAVRVANEPGGLTLTWQEGGLTADLGHWHFDTFEATYRDRRYGTTRVRFILDDEGGAHALQLFGIPFTRQPDPAPATQAAR